MGLYPTIELVTDQEKQVRDYYNQFDPDEFAQLDSLYGAELARRVEEAEKGNKFKELWLSLKQNTSFNPDIFSPGGSLSFRTLPTTGQSCRRLGKKPRFIRC